MKKQSKWLGLIRVAKASSFFALTSLAICLFAKIALDSTRPNPWDGAIIRDALWSIPVATAVCAFAAFLSYGASGAQGDNPSSDFRDIFQRLVVRHLLFGIGFLSPILLMAHDGHFNKIMGGIAALFLIPMVVLFLHVDGLLIVKAESRNKDLFLREIGGSYSTSRKSRGIRRD